MSILVITSPTSTLRIVELEPRTLVVGRAVSADIHIADRSVSRAHARIAFDERTGEHTLQDLGSFNGVYLGADRLESAHVLRDGDTFSLGSATVRFRTGFHGPRPGPASDSVSLLQDVPTAAPEGAVRTPWRDSVSA